MQTVVGVLRGGPSREHEVSLRTGAAMLASLPEEEYTTRDIYIDTQGVWHDRGRPTSPDRVLRQLDVVLNGLHGEYGEDGEVQKLLERFGVPYAGADSYGSHLAMHKVMSKHYAAEAGLLTPEFRYVEQVGDSEAVAREVIRNFRQPVVVKPVNWGSSIGVSIVGGYTPVLAAIEQLFAAGASSVVVEEYIRGREATAGVIEDFRDAPLYTLPPVEIVPPEGNFFSYGAKYSGDTKEFSPGRFTRVENEELQRLAKVMHQSLGLRHYSRSDFILAPKGIYYLETNSLPTLHPQNSFTRALSAVGVVLGDFISHLVAGAMSY